MRWADQLAPKRHAGGNAALYPFAEIAGSPGRVGVLERYEYDSPRRVRAAAYAYAGRHCLRVKTRLLDNGDFQIMFEPREIGVV